jgi:GTP pyrophosphokinase
MNHDVPNSQEPHSTENHQLVGQKVANEARDIVASLGGNQLFQHVLSQLSADFFHASINNVPSVTLTPSEKQSFPKLFKQLKELVDLEQRLLPKTEGKNEHQKTLSTSIQATQKQLQRRMLLSSINDLRIAVLWLSFRLAKLRCASQQIFSVSTDWLQQSLSLHAGLANRLSLWQLKWELEDLSFRLLEPQTYHTIAKALEEKRTQRTSFIDQATQKIKRGLHQYHLDGNIKGRPKHIYSIHKKMQGKQKTLDEVYDLRAIRVIVDTPAACYTALGVVHDLWTPIPKEFDDYIAVPKPNGYQSLHTVVKAEDHRPLEIQIRTQEMHLYAEYGVAAHWHYKESSPKQAYAGKSVLSGTDSNRRNTWAKELLDWDADITGDATTNSPKQIYVFTPAGEVVELDQGATPIDFAYAVHTQLGHRCRGAKIDDHLAALYTPLKTGQTVEIIASKQEGVGPSRDWLNPDSEFVKTNRAKIRIRSWFLSQQIDTLKQHGRSLLEKELQRLGKTSLALQQVANQCGFSDMDSFFLALAREEFSSRQLQETLSPSSPPADSPPNKIAQVVLEKAQQTARRIAKKNTHAINVQGLSGVHTQIAQCCRPMPPDELLGFVAKGKGISIHRKNCKNIQRMAEQFPERTLAVHWDDALYQTLQNTSEQTDSTYLAKIRVCVSQEVDILKLLVDVLAKYQINLKSYEQSTPRHRKGEKLVELMVWVKNRNVLEQFSQQIQQTTEVTHIDLG